MEIEVLSTYKNQLLACDHYMSNKHMLKGWAIMCFYSRHLFELEHCKICIIFSASNKIVPCSEKKKNGYNSVLDTQWHW